MISRNLILGETGAVILVQDAPFGNEIVRAEFFTETGYLILTDINEDTIMVEYEFTDPKVLTALQDAGRLMVLSIDAEGMPDDDGFDVPLIVVRP